MKLAGAVYRRLRCLCSKLRSLYYRERLIRVEARLSKEFYVGANVTFTVPVLSGGAGAVRIGDRNTFGFYLAPKIGNGAILIQAREKVSQVIIGEGSAWSNNVSIIAAERITIGDECQIGDLVSIYDCDFHEISPRHRNRSAGSTGPVSIGNNVWLGSRVMVLKGVTIGDNSVIGAMSLVTRSIPSNSVAAGVPARVIRSLA